MIMLLTWAAASRTVSSTQAMCAVGCGQTVVGMRAFLDEVGVFPGVSIVRFAVTRRSKRSGGEAVPRVICPWASCRVAAWGCPMVIDKVRILVCLNVIHVMDELEIATSSTHIPTAQTPVMDVENSREEASDNGRQMTDRDL